MNNQKMQDNWIIKAARMVESEFFLGLEKDNEPHIIFEILGNTRLTGNPPSLLIYKGHPEYFQITFQSGNGAGWLEFGEDKKVFERLKQIIEVNTRLYEITKNGYITEKDFAPFMSLAYTVYEAY